MVRIMHFPFWSVAWRHLAGTGGIAIKARTSAVPRPDFAALVSVYLPRPVPAPLV
jgi:hypothetical protein